MFMLIYWPSCTFFGDCLSWFPYKTYQVFSMCSKKREMIIENGSGELTLRCLYRHSLRIICKNRLHYGTTPFPWSNHPTSRYLLIIKCNYCLKPHCLSKCFRFVYRVPENFLQEILKDVFGCKNFRRFQGKVVSPCEVLNS